MSARSPALARGGRLARRRRLGCGRARSGGTSAEAATLARGRAVLRRAAARAALLAAARLLVDGRPRPARCLARWDSAVLVAVLDMLGPALLLVRVLFLRAPGH